MAAQFPQFVFKYGSKRYGFIAQLKSLFNEVIETKCINLDQGQIVDFEYISSLNNLYLTGEMTYNDPVGVVANALQDQYIRLVVQFGEIKESNNDCIDNPELSENSVSLTFIVDSIQILSRTVGDITYKFNLVSENYWLLAANVNFSNYDKDPETISEIIKSCLMKNANDQVSVDYNTFDQYKDDNLKLNYITNGNDNCITITKYLLDKQFLYTDKIEGIKFLYYDEITNSYKFLQMKEIESNKHLADDKKKNISTIILSMYSSSNEEDNLYVRNNQLATVVGFPKTTMFKSMFNRLLGSYDYNQNILCTNFDINTQTILEVINNKQQVIDVEDKYKQFPVNDLNFKEFNLSSEGTIWNNDYSCYSDLCHELLEDNALIIHTDGSIFRTVGGLVFVTTPYNQSDLLAGQSQLEKDIANRYNQLRGMWIIGKVRHIIKPATNEYTQNLILFKNYKENTVDPNNSFIFEYS